MSSAIEWSELYELPDGFTAMVDDYTDAANGVDGEAEMEDLQMSYNRVALSSLVDHVQAGR